MKFYFSSEYLFYGGKVQTKELSGQQKQQKRVNLTNYSLILSLWRSLQDQQKIPGSPGL